MNDLLEPSPTEPPPIQSSTGQPIQEGPAGLAVFDFDATLAKGDSLWPFLLKAVGGPRCYWAAFCAGVTYLVHPFSKDKRTIIKRVLLKKTLTGKSLEELQPAIEAMSEWPEWMDTVDELKRHHVAGHKILIASGGLDLYLPSMLKDVPYHDIICTKMEVVSGVLTGRMATGNCVRQLKAKMVKDYMETHGPFSESWGYGNQPHDLPMMTHLDRSFVIDKE